MLNLFFFKNQSFLIINLYLKFKSEYKIPKSLLLDIMKCSYLNYYYSPSELNEYYCQWITKSTTDFVSYTKEQYKIYEDIRKEKKNLRKHIKTLRKAYV